MDDLISRKALCDYALNQKDKSVTPNDIMRFPSAQPEPCEDTVSRQRLLSDLKELVAAWKKYPVMAEQIKGVEAAIGYVEAIPSAQPEEDCDTCKHGYFGGACCDNCKVGFPSHYERRTDE